MKRFPFCFQVLICALVLVPAVFSQSGRVKDAGTTPANGEPNKPANETPLAANDSRTPLQLYDEANDYVKKKFAEFEKRNMPYDQRLEEKIKQEQRDLAARYATQLAGRKLEPKDIYYLGLLYNLARNYDSALEAMRRYLNGTPDANGEAAQDARALIVIQTAKKGLLPEAETRLAEYAGNQPQVAGDRYVLENWMVSGYFNKQDYEHALPHAQELLKAAKLGQASWFELPQLFLAMPHDHLER